MLIGLAILFFQGAPPFMPPPAPPAVIENRVVNEVHVIPQPLDPEAVAEATVQSNKASIGMVVAPPPIDWANELLNLPDIWRTTPPDLTFRNGAIRDRSGMMWQAAAALLGVAVLGFGAAKALGQDPSAGRFIFAIVMAMGSLMWWEIGISLNNAICAAINAPDLPSLIRPHLGLPTDPVEQTAEVVLVVVYALVAIMLLFSLIFRLCMIVVLIAVGPLALLCYALPQTEGLAQKYVSLSVGLLFSQVLIVLGLSLAQVLSLGTGMQGTLMSLGILLILRRVPGMLTSGMERGGRSMIGQIASLTVLRRFGLR